MEFRRLIRLMLNGAIVAIMIAPLIAASVWIYSASSAAFRFQHEIRAAQDARSRLIRVFLATESDVRGFAATADPYFAASYRARVRTFDALAAALDKDLRPLKIPGGRRLVTRERHTYAQWKQTVAVPILNAAHAGKRHLLRTVDPAFALRMLADDHGAGRMLEDAAAESEVRRQELLRRILAASVALVGLVASTVIVLLLQHAAAEQRELKQAVLYEEERRVSRMLQSALAPEHLPSIQGVTLRAKYVPATQERQIGGDWYEAVDLRRGRTLLIIGDVAGHGLEAAVVMNKARQAILSAAVTDSDPARILQAANRSLGARISRMVTAACCVFDPSAMTLIYATAGHPPPVVAPARGGAFVLPNGGPPLGVVDDLEIVSLRFAFDPGSLLVLYTDGLIEERRDLLSSETSLLAAAERCSDAFDPAGEIFATLLPDQHPRDDVAILTMRVDRTARSVSAHRSARYRSEMSSEVICSSLDTRGRA